MFLCALHKVGKALTLTVFRLHREYSSIHLKAIIVVYRLYNLLRMVPVLSPPAMTLPSMSGPCQGH